MGLYDFSLYDLIGRNAQCFRNRPAWFEADTGTTTTFGQFKLQVDRLAAGLQQAGIKNGDRIGVVGKNSLAFFQIYGAAAALGAIVLPINWRLSADEMAFNLNDCTPAVIFTDEKFGDMVAGIRNQLPSVKHFVNLNDAGPFDAFDRLMVDAPLSTEPIEADAGLVIIHTAAVAGRPRGALVSHANLLCASLHLNYCFGLSPADVHLNLLPLFHVGGLFMAVNAFHAGALNVNMSKFDADEAVDLIQAQGVSVFFDFSPILGSILDAQEKTGADISSLRAVMGLEAPETIERYQKRPAAVSTTCTARRKPPSSPAWAATMTGPVQPDGRSLWDWWNWWMMRTMPCRRDRWAKSPSKAPWCSKGTGTWTRTMPTPSATGGITPATWAASTKTGSCGTPAASRKRS